MINSETHVFDNGRQSVGRRSTDRIKDSFPMLHGEQKKINWKLKVTMALLAGFWTGLVYLHWLLSQCQI
jgi:hypothetical protein